MPSRQNGAYISQILHTDPAIAGAELDSVYRGLQPVGVSRRFVRLTAGLWLSGDGLQRDPGFHVVRAVRGLLWYGCLPVRVLVELVEWSSTGCEVAIRPLGYSWPVWTDRYAHCAAGHLDSLVSSLDSIGESGVARLRATNGVPFFLINGWNTAGSFERGLAPRQRQWNDAATPAVGPLA
jgi:hypothetical protein